MPPITYFPSWLSSSLRSFSIIPQLFWFGFENGGMILDGEKHRLVQDVEGGLPSEPGYGILRGI
jgi:hypothetical protein